jgi:hypothetical protein
MLNHKLAPACVRPLKAPAPLGAGQQPRQMPLMRRSIFAFLSSNVRSDQDIASGTSVACGGRCRPAPTRARSIFRTQAVIRRQMERAVPRSRKLRMKPGKRPTHASWVELAGAMPTQSTRQRQCQDMPICSSSVSGSSAPRERLCCVDRCSSRDIPSNTSTSRSVEAAVASLRFVFRLRGCALSGK